METTFFLFGTEPCEVARQVFDASVIAYLINKNQGALVKFNSAEEHPSELISKYDGWGDWMELDADQYDEINSKLL